MARLEGRGSARGALMRVKKRPLEKASLQWEHESVTATKTKPGIGSNNNPTEFLPIRWTIAQWRDVGERKRYEDETRSVFRIITQPIAAATDFTELDKGPAYSWN